MNELWLDSNANTREKWRDIAKVVRKATDLSSPDDLAECLQILYWFGAISSAAGRGTRGELGLRNLLQESRAGDILHTLSATVPAPQIPGIRGKRNAAKQSAQKTRHSTTDYRTSPAPTRGMNAQRRNDRPRHRSHFGTLSTIKSGRPGATRT